MRINIPQPQIRKLFFQIVRITKVKSIDDLKIKGIKLSCSTEKIKFWIMAGYNAHRVKSCFLYTFILNALVRKLRVINEVPKYLQYLIKSPFEIWIISLSKDFWYKNSGFRKFTYLPAVAEITCRRHDIDMFFIFLL